jgi:N-acetylmuramoyl-L-alanine amidase
MKKRYVVVTFLIVCLLFGGFTLAHLENSRVQETFSDAVLQQGFYGDDVIELQSRLKYLGYYDGVIDGDFGPSTKNAVTWFQWKFGMKSDGIVGQKTKSKLYQSTSGFKAGDVYTGSGMGSNTTVNNVQGGGTNYSTASKSSGNTSSSTQKSTNLGFSESDLKLMANAVYGESRGEPYEGQVAVAAVILNRVKSENFPNTISGVIMQPGAFTAVADGQIYLTPNETAARAVQDAINGWDPSTGAEYYFNPVTATSKWIWSREQIKTIGKHIFAN